MEPTRTAAAVLPVRIVSVISVGHVSAMVRASKAAVLMMLRVAAVAILTVGVFIESMRLMQRESVVRINLSSDTMNEAMEVMMSSIVAHHSVKMAHTMLHAMATRSPI